MVDRSESKAFHDILGAIRSIRDEIHDIGKNQKPSEHKNEKPLSVELTSELRLPIYVTEHYKSQQRQWKAYWEKFKVGLEVIAFFGAVLAAIYTVRTFSQVERQSDIAYDQWRDLRKDFEVDHRSWIKVTAAFPKALAPEYEVKFTLSNVGKSVSLKWETGVAVEIVDSLEAPSFTHGTSIFYRGYAGLLFPSDIHEFITGRTPSAADGSFPPLTEDEIQRLQSGSAYVAAFGVVEYTDNFGDHWTRFCTWRGYPKTGGGNYRSGPCVQWNAVGDGPSPIHWRGGIK